MPQRVVARRGTRGRSSNAAANRSRVAAFLPRELQPRPTPTGSTFVDRVGSRRSSACSTSSKPQHAEPGDDLGDRRAEVGHSATRSPATACRRARPPAYLLQPLDAVGSSASRSRRRTTLAPRGAQRDVAFAALRGRCEVRNTSGGPFSLPRSACARPSVFHTVSVRSRPPRSARERARHVEVPPVAVGVVGDEVDRDAGAAQPLSSSRRSRSRSRSAAPRRAPARPCLPSSRAPGSSRRRRARRGRLRASAEPRVRLGRCLRRARAAGRCRRRSASRS